MLYVSLYTTIPTPEFDLTTQDSHLTILVDAFTNHIVNEIKKVEIKKVAWGLFFFLFGGLLKPRGLNLLGGGGGWGGWQLLVEYKTQLLKFI